MVGESLTVMGASIKDCESAQFEVQDTTSRELDHEKTAAQADIEKKQEEIAKV